MKPTQPLHKALRRLALTTKSTRKGYYKGTGTGSMGRHTKHGGYVIEWEKVRTYVVPPELKIYRDLTPFVTREKPIRPGKFAGDPKGAVSGEAYLARWKEKFTQGDFDEVILEPKKPTTETEKSAEATKG